MKRARAMPFGATVMTSGDVLFRLSAPQASSVELLLNVAETPTVTVMQAIPGGWFEHVGPAARGTRPWCTSFMSGRLRPRARSPVSSPGCRAADDTLAAGGFPSRADQITGDCFTGWANSAAHDRCGPPTHSIVALAPGGIEGLAYGCDP